MPQQTSPEITFELPASAGGILRGLLLLILMLVVVGTWANFIIYQVAAHPDDDLAKVMRRLDLGHEPSVPNWYSSLALVGCAALLLLIARIRQPTRAARQWLGLAVLFLLLAIDEAVVLHDMVDTLIQRHFQLSGIFFFSWVIPGLGFAALVALVYAKFLWSLPKKTRHLMVAAGAIFVAGAVGMEMVAGVIIEQEGVASIRHTFVQAVEEFLEMLGVALFLYALIDYLAQMQVCVVWRPAVAGREQPAAHRKPEYSGE